MATQNASDLKIQELEAQLGLLQAQTERASSLDYALIQVQERAQAADAHISYLQDQLVSVQKLVDHEKEARQQAQEGLTRLHTECWQHKEARDYLQTRLAAAEARAGHAEEQLFSGAARTLPDLTPAQPAAGATLSQQSQPEAATDQAASSGGAVAMPDGPQAASAAQLQEQVARLKGARDKLLAQLDTQSADLERASTEGQVLSQGLQESRALARAWELQAQEALTKIEHLKEMLGEGIDWQAQQQEQQRSQSPRRSGSISMEPGLDTILEEVPQGQDRRKALEQALLEERAAKASLDLQVRALCAELTRASDTTGELGRSVLPALTGIETRLANIVKRPAGLGATAA